MSMADQMDRHISELTAVLRRLDHATVTRWGELIAQRLGEGARLLIIGNGGSASQAAHLSAELVGRFQSERRPLSAMSLTSDTASLTAVGNDYGFHQVFARQVRAHGRPGDVLLVISASGRSQNLLTACTAAHDEGLASLALTGARPNPLADLCSDFLAVGSTLTTTIQESHLVVIHALCGVIDEALAVGPGRAFRRPLA
jgi:phosphoheptose isomerase